MNTDSTLALKEKLYEIMNQKLLCMEYGMILSTEHSRMNRLNEEWNEYLNTIGLTRISKIMSLVLGAPHQESDVWITDPLSFGTTQGVISMPLETATKIVALGYIP